MLEIRDIENHRAALEDPAEISKIREGIQAGALYVARRLFPPEELGRIREYLANVGRSSLPNYQSIEEGCPNFHRLNANDSRAYVDGCFHQFAFFPWNQDVFGLFGRFAEVYHLKNLLSDLPRETFLGTKPQDGCTARLSFQFYPSGKGALNKHSDPVDYHQLTVPILQMSTKGKDFSTGGAYVEDGAGGRVCLDDVTECGDVVYFKASLLHGVEPIDPGHPVDWLSFRGRWMLLFAVNRLSSNSRIGNAVDVTRKPL
jgi:hypothetical protein